MNVRRDRLLTELLDEYFAVLATLGVIALFVGGARLTVAYGPVGLLPPAVAAIIALILYRAKDRAKLRHDLELLKAAHVAMRHWLGEVAEVSQKAEADRRWVTRETQEELRRRRSEVEVETVRRLLQVPRIRKLLARTSFESDLRQWDADWRLDLERHRRRVEPHRPRLRVQDPPHRLERLVPAERRPPREREPRERAEGERVRPRRRVPAARDLRRVEAHAREERRRGRGAEDHRRTVEDHDGVGRERAVRLPARRESGDGGGELARHAEPLRERSVRRGELGERPVHG
jgi:hypothetical protein